MFDIDNIHVKEIIKIYNELSEPFKKCLVEFSQYLEMKDKHQQEPIH